MKIAFQKVKKFFIRIRQFFKSQLPLGMKEFDDWSNSIIDGENLPNNDSFKFALATMIMHAKEDADRLPKRYFGKRLKKSASNQVAAAVVQELKAKQQAAMAKLAAEEEAKKNAIQ